MDNDRLKKHSKLRWKKILENYRSGYNYNDNWEIAVIELIANSVDAKASVIMLNINDLPRRKITLSCIDNGLGMDEKEFEEYHNLGSMTKERGGTIGFAGIGAKLMLDLCDHIYTETKKVGKTPLASIWEYDIEKDEPFYKYTKPENRLKNFDSGTYVRVNGLKVEEISLEKIKNVIYTNYQYLLDEKEIYLNGEKLVSPLKKLRELSKANKK